MLILTRKQGEAFLIGENIEISISEINGDRVRIAIEAPKEVKILRKELKDAGDLNIEAAGTAMLPTAENLSNFANLVRKQAEKK
ncbi:carbon storage regulator [Aminipila butyrica]|uniref:Translational regulator CsrA n=1 Tax=Aminipila butyrica TaxID=433296 RepID=A0A858BUD8_9FIRM|nr:carbon storage regulator [Aminipila butyrica]QIB68394.1 carbon storage regulator [Aminipila butyrica]